MSKIEKAGLWVARRIEEPSTWSGAGIVAVTLHSFGISDPLTGALLAVGAAIGGLLAVLLPEKSA